MHRMIKIASAVGTSIAILVTIFAFAAKSESVIAAPATQVSSSKGEIGVSGTGRVAASPDVAVATVGVQITAPTLGEATKDARAQMEKVLEAIKAQGIKPEDIQTSNYSVYPLQDYSQRGDPAKTVGYQVNNLVTIKIRAIDQTGKVLDAAIQAGANSLSGVNLTINDPKPYEMQARDLAVRNAIAKAQTLAAAAGVKVGSLISITDSPSAQPPVFNTARKVAVAQSAVGPVETGELEISVNVEMHFEIE